VGSEDFRFFGIEEPRYARISDFGCEEFDGSSTIRMGSSTSMRSVMLGSQQNDQNSEKCSHYLEFGVHR
jgi:hypothetical protein